jgi:restriction system protein
MPEITARRRGELMRALFEVLLLHPEGLAASQAIAEVERYTPPTPFEQGEYPGSPGVRRFDKTSVSAPSVR